MNIQEVIDKLEKIKKAYGDDVIVFGGRVGHPSHVLPENAVLSPYANKKICYICIKEQ